MIFSDEILNLFKAISLMDWGVVHDDDCFVWETFWKAVQEKAEVLSTHTFGLGPFRVEKFVVNIACLRQGPNQGHLFHLWNKA